MNSGRFGRIFSWLVALVLLIACMSSVYIPFSGARWNEILRIDGQLTDWLPFRPMEGEKNCTQPRFYWLANPNAWPLNTLPLAGFTIPKAEALRQLELTSESSPVDILTAELSSAYLNRAHGADTTLIDPLINEAEAALILSGVPEGRQYVKDERTLFLARTLADYNEGRIGPGTCPELTPTETLAPSPTPLSCSYTLSYWVDHPGAWAVQELQAGASYTQAAARILLLNDAKSTDLATLLTRQLIGARLSMAAGVPLGDWLSAMELSESWLQRHPIGSGIDPEAENAGRVLLMFLEKVNNGEIGLELCLEAKVTPSPTASSTPSPTFSPLDCSYPLIYWVEHPEAWDLQEIQAGIKYTQPEAINFLLSSGTNTDLAALLTRQLIGARLNLAAGVSLGDWLSAMELSESWLQQNPIGTKIDPEAESDGQVLLMLLEKINNGEIGLDFCSEAQITPSPSNSLTPSFTPTPSSTLTPSSTPRPSVSPAVTQVPTADMTPVITLTPIPSATYLPSSTPPPATQVSPIPSASAKPSGTPQPSLQPVHSTTPTASDTPKPSPSLTPEPPGTHTPTATEALIGLPSITPEVLGTETPTSTKIPNPSTSPTP